jgi:hypothetical protein
LILLLVGWPLLVLVVSVVGGFIIGIEPLKLERAFKAAGDWVRSVNKSGLFRMESKCSFITWPVRLMVIIPTYMFLLACFVFLAALQLSITLFLGAFFFGFMVVPTWLVLFYVFGKQLYIWNGDRTYQNKKNRALQQA